MKTTLRKVAALSLLCALAAAAQPLPVDLPPADAKPPATGKPVKIYIQSGQSNSLGFGAVKPGAPQYSKVFLSADPTARPAGLPVANAALLRLVVHDATASVFSGAFDPDAEYPNRKPAKKESVALAIRRRHFPPSKAPTPSWSMR